MRLRVSFLMMKKLSRSLMLLKSLWDKTLPKPIDFKSINSPKDARSSLSSERLLQSILETE
jgi:hypothetical protein